MIYVIFMCLKIPMVGRFPEAFDSNKLDFYPFEIPQFPFISRKIALVEKKNETEKSTQTGAP